MFFKTLGISLLAIAAIEFAVPNFELEFKINKNFLIFSTIFGISYLAIKNK